MNKKIVLAVTLILTCAILACVFTACNNNGADGLSAYELAVQEGFEGTLEEWLQSLQGADGSDGVNGLDGNDVSIEEIYSLAVQNGYEGSYLDFLKEYLSLDLDDDTAAINTALLSSVKIECGFEITETVYNPVTGPQQSTYSATSSGSGVIYTLDKSAGDAYIITNHHVVYYSKSNTSDGISDDIRVMLYGSEDSDYAIEASYLGGSSTYDIAVLKITGSDILKNSQARAVQVADYHSANVGTTAYAIGNAAGEGISVTEGIISVDSEVISISDSTSGTSSSYRVMRVDAAINSGNSGGGLFNGQSQLIGIVNAKVSSSSIENIGYAIPVSIAVEVAQNIIDNCDGETVKTVQKYSLGISVAANSSKAVYDGYTMTTKIVEEVIVDSVDESGIAYGQLENGDVVLSVSVNGVKTQVDRTFKIVDAMLCVREGDIVVFEIMRGGEALSVEFTASAEYIASVS